MNVNIQAWFRIFLHCVVGSVDIVQATWSDNKFLFVKDTIASKLKFLNKSFKFKFTFFNEWKIWLAIFSFVFWKKCYSSHLMRQQLLHVLFFFLVKQMNRHLVAIFQFIVSVAAGFAFGFIGVELIIGSLDFGFRLLLGIICALTIALAELYFLAKRLNEDIQMEYIIEKQYKSKVD